MIDYVKIKVIDVDAKRLLAHPLLEFKRVVNEKTGELSTNTICHYHFCAIKIFDSGVVVFSGSIHKMYNSLSGIVAPNYQDVKDYRGYNGNQFNYHEIDFIRQHLAYLFEAEPSQMIFQNIELGINLTVPFDPQLFLTGLLMFEGKSFEFRFNEYYAQSIHSQYIVKIYNKGNQYIMPLNTMRFEMKITTMEFLHRYLGFHTMSDITKVSMITVFNFLSKQLSKVHYYDNSLSIEGLSEKNRIKCKDYSNPRYWRNLPSNKRYRPKKHLQQLINKYSHNLRKQMVDQLTQNCIRFERHIETSLCIKYEPSNIESNPIHFNRKRCIVTGVNLEFEKVGSKYIKTTTLRHLQVTDKGKFSELCSFLLSSTTFNTPKYERDLISHLAKQVRNRYYSPSRIKRLGYNSKSFKNGRQLTMF